MKNKETRYERKWELISNEVNTIILKILKSKFNFRESFKKRFVNSIYFDDKNLTSILQNIDGLNIKTKYRVRWYGDRNRITNPIFEIKSKKGFITFKQLSELKDLSNANFDNKGINQISHLVNLHINNRKILIPITSTHYERYYFISSNNLIRATLDTQISSSNLYKYCDYSIKKNFSRKIFELKYPKNLDSYVRNNFQNLFPRLSKSSKYVFSSIDNSNFYSV